MSILHLDSKNFDAAINGDLPVLVDFFAVWCGPCKMLAPVLEEFAEKAEGRAVVAKVDIDKAPELATKYGVMSVPTLMAFKNGQPAAKSIGFVPMEKLEELINA